MAGIYKRTKQPFRVGAAVAPALRLEYMDGSSVRTVPAGSKGVVMDISGTRLRVSWDLPAMSYSCQGWYDAYQLRNA